VHGEFRDLFSARTIYRENGNQRLELECRLLAGQSNAEIAAIMNLLEPMVETYECIFYNVRPRLYASSWVALSAIGTRKFTTKTGEPNIGIIARHFAYFGGEHVLAMVLPRLLDGSALSEEPLDLNTPAGRTTMRVRLAIQTATMPTDRKTSLELIRIWPCLRPYLSPLPVAPTWNGVLMNKVSSLPDSVLRQAVARARVTHRPRATEHTLQPVEATEEFQSRLLAQRVA